MNIFAPKWAIPLSLGFSVIPVPPHRKIPIVKWKMWQTQVPPDSIIEQWDAAYPGCNVAILTGAQSGIIGFDMDSEDAVMRAYEKGLPDTLMVRTPRGLHAYFKHPGERISNKANIAPGWDIRGDGGYLMGPGSVFTPAADEAAAGKLPGAYEWVNLGTPIADAPEWVYAGHQHKRVDRSPHIATAYRGPTVNGDAAVEEQFAALEAVEVGSGLNDQINRTSFALGQLVAGGYAEPEETWARLEELVEIKGTNPAKDIGTMTSGWNAGQQQPCLLARTPDEALGADAPAMPEGRRPTEVPMPISVGPRERPNVMAPSQFPDYFEGVVYVTTRDEFFTPEGLFLKRSAFDGTYGGPTFMLGAAGSGPSKSPSDAFLKNETWVAPRAHGTCFRPEMPPGSLIQEDELLLLNCYVPLHVPRKAGDASRFLSHLALMIPDEHDRDILLHWMASACQNVGKKFFWWPAIQGTKGNGKTMLLDIMTYCIGRRYTHLVNPEAMLKTGNQFNDWILNKMFIGIEEIRTDGRRDLLNMLKTTVTSLSIVAEGKGLKQVTVDNRANGMALTNYQDGLPIDDDERRYAIFFTAQQRAEDIIRDGMGGEYFPKLWDWLREDGFAIIYDYLLTFPLRAELDPAQDAHRAPLTTSTKEAVSASMGIVEQEILEAVAEGRPGFVGGIINSKAVSALAEKMRRSIPSRKMRAMMQTLGYDWHPRLPDGRATTPVQGAYGGKVRLYVQHGHAALLLPSSAEVSALYDSLQAEGSLG